MNEEMLTEIQEMVLGLIEKHRLCPETYELCFALKLLASYSELYYSLLGV